MKYISDNEYYDLLVPILLTIVRRKHPSAQGFGKLNFSENDKTGFVKVLSFNCFICEQLITVPQDNYYDNFAIQFVRNHYLLDLKNKNLLPFF